MYALINGQYFFFDPSTYNFDVDPLGITGAGVEYMQQMPAPPAPVPAPAPIPAPVVAPPVYEPPAPTPIQVLQDIVNTPTYTEPAPAITPIQMLQDIVSPEAAQQLVEYFQTFPVEAPTVSAPAPEPAYIPPAPVYTPIPEPAPTPEPVVQPQPVYAPEPAYIAPASIETPTTIIEPTPIQLLQDLVSPEAAAQLVEYFQTIQPEPAYVPPPEPVVPIVTEATPTVAQTPIEQLFSIASVNDYNWDVDPLGVTSAQSQITPPVTEPPVNFVAPAPEQTAPPVSVPVPDTTVPVAPEITPEVVTPQELTPIQLLQDIIPPAMAQQLVEYFQTPVAEPTPAPMPVVEPTPVAPTVTQAPVEPITNTIDMNNYNWDVDPLGLSAAIQAPAIPTPEPAPVMAAPIPTPEPPVYAPEPAYAAPVPAYEPPAPIPVVTPSVYDPRTDPNYNWDVDPLGLSAAVPPVIQPPAPVQLPTPEPVPAPQVQAEPTITPAITQTEETMPYNPYTDPNYNWDIDPLGLGNPGYIPPAYTPPAYIPPTPPAYVPPAPAYDPRTDPNYNWDVDPLGLGSQSPPPPQGYDPYTDPNYNWDIDPLGLGNPAPNTSTDPNYNYDTQTSTPPLTTSTPPPGLNVPYALMPMAPRPPVMTQSQLPQWNLNFDANAILGQRNAMFGTNYSANSPLAALMAIGNSK